MTRDRRIRTKWFQNVRDGRSHPGVMSGGIGFISRSQPLSITYRMMGRVGDRRRASTNPAFLNAEGSPV